jgi:hypothetical protein
MSRPALLDLKVTIHDAGLSSEVSSVASILQAYGALSTKETPLTSAEQKIYFDCCDHIMTQGFDGKQVEALTAMSGLIATYGLEAFRPAETPPEDPPQP